MKQYIKPEIKELEIEIEDVIAASGEHVSLSGWIADKQDSYSDSYWNS